MEPFFEALRKGAQAFGPALARLSYSRGLAVTGPDGTTRPIPVTATPIVIDGAELRRRAGLAAHLSSAGLKMARFVLAGPRRELLLGALSPLEREVALRTFVRARALATTRVDFFVSAGAPLALELNATIPAMQGYSDIAARSFIEVAGRHWGLSDAEISRICAQTPSNARALYDALLLGFAVERGREPRRIGLLCRRNDPQLTEQRYLCERFREWGTDADVVHPDELSRSPGAYELIYRHLFVRRLEEPNLAGAAFAKELLQEPAQMGAVLLNPPASQVEVKTTFALLSQARFDEALASGAALTCEERDAAARAVPWTRLFREGPAVGPAGEQLTDLVAHVAAEPSRFVLKRSWEYGGRAVFVGRTEGEPSFDERVQAAYGARMSWRALCKRTAADTLGGGFVVQALVDTAPEEHLLCGEAAPVPTALHVDFSAYASVGLPEQPAWGGVCRGSVSHIVNIVGGGGVLPLITAEAAGALDTARVERNGGERLGRRP